MVDILGPAAIRELEREAVANTDSIELMAHNVMSETELGYTLDGADLKDSRIKETLFCLPTNQHGVLAPEFLRYYRRPWNGIFWDYQDPYNDLVIIAWGPRGGGKTITGVSLNIIDGQMKGTPCISNVPFAWIAKDNRGNLYKVESLPFDQEAFARGDETFKFKRLLIDEGNYLADRLRSTSNKNLAMTDILQQARKFRMTVIFCTINWMWLDPRVTGSLCDILIECNDLYYRMYGRRHGMKKGYRIAWELFDQSGKTTGRQFNRIGATVFNARLMWHTFNTENFVDPREARRKLQAEQKTMVDQFGNEVTVASWYERIYQDIQKLAEAQELWSGDDLWGALGIESHGLRVKAGSFMRSKLDISKRLDMYGKSTYNLSSLTENNQQYY